MRKNSESPVCGIQLRYSEFYKPSGYLGSSFPTAHDTKTLVFSHEISNSSTQLELPNTACQENVNMKPDKRNRG